MLESDPNNLATVHVHGNLLRGVWWGKEIPGCIVVRPSGPERDEIAFIVRQVRIDGPSVVRFDTQDRATDVGRSSDDTCEPVIVLNAGEKSDGNAETYGSIGNLPGFDNAILVYQQAAEEHIAIQLEEDGPFVPFLEFRDSVSRGDIIAPFLSPGTDAHCLTEATRIQWTG